MFFLFMYNQEKEEKFNRAYKELRYARVAARRILASRTEIQWITYLLLRRGRQ